MHTKRVIGSVLMLWFVLCGAAAAQEEADPDATRYVRITKDMVVNYGDPSLKRLKYIKFAVDARVGSLDSAEVVMHHQPALIDRLVILFSEQDEMLIHSAQGKEEVRMHALAELQEIVAREEGEAHIQDLLFTTFIVQR